MSIAHELHQCSENSVSWAMSVRSRSSALRMMSILCRARSAGWIRSSAGSGDSRAQTCTTSARDRSAMFARSRPAGFCVHRLIPLAFVSPLQERLFAERSAEKKSMKLSHDKALHGKQEELYRVKAWDGWVQDSDFLHWRFRQAEVRREQKLTETEKARADALLLSHRPK